MSKIDLSGTTEISDEGIKKHFKNIEPCQAVFELVWNGFDAKAKNVDVLISENSIHSVDRVSVCDDGDGIDINNIKESFGRFNDSQKKEDAAQHGLHGRGRLAFHRLSHEATWHSKAASGHAVISIAGANIKRFNGSTIEPNKQHKSLEKHPTGTYVELQKFHTNLPDIETLRKLFSTEFGWYLALNKNRALRINGVNISVPSHELHNESIKINGIVFDATIIRWDEKPSSEKSYTYLQNTYGSVVHKQLSTFNNKTNFFTSICISSSWADNFSPSGSDLFSPDSKTVEMDEWKKLIRKLGVITQQVYDDFLRRFVDSEIEKYVEDGIFPSYDNLDVATSTWRINNTKNLIRAVYIADPVVLSSLNKKQKKVIVRLLDKLAISNENDSIFEVLTSVLELDDVSMNTFASQLKRTTLENIVSTIEVLQRRQLAANKMRELMNVHYKDVLETPDLQKVIENNTWLFGHRYETLGAEEDTFTKIARSLRDSVPTIHSIEDNDLEEGANKDGANRQTDLFLARKIPHFDSFGKKIYRCIIVEIKRPSVALNVKHLRQLDDYANIIRKHPEFSSELMHFELILIGRKISSADAEIESRMKSQVQKGEMGLVSDDGRIKRYVLNWYTVLDDFELSNSFMLNRLKLQREALSELSKEELVKDLQTCEA